LISSIGAQSQAYGFAYDPAAIWSVATKLPPRVLGRVSYKTYDEASQYGQGFTGDYAGDGNKGVGRLVGIYSETGNDWLQYDAQGRVLID
jgi:hypothetical protein